MGLQRRTAIAALAIQRRIAEALSDQPFFQPSCSLPQVHKKLVGLAPVKQPEEMLHDIKLVQLFQQSLGLRQNGPQEFLRSESRDIEPILLKLKSRAKEQVRKGTHTNQERSISHSYESLTDELLRVSEQRERRRFDLVRSSSDNINTPAAQPQKEDRTDNCGPGFKIEVPPLQTDRTTIPSLLEPPHTLQAYRLQSSLNDEIATASDQGSQAKVTRFRSKNEGYGVAGLKRLIWQSKSTQSRKPHPPASDDFQQGFYLSLLNS